MARDHGVWIKSMQDKKDDVLWCLLCRVLRLSHDDDNVPEFLEAEYAYFD